MKFRTEAELQEHGRMHMQPMAAHRDLTCQACGASFHSETELKQHGARRDSGLITTDVFGE